MKKTIGNGRGRLWRGARYDACGARTRNAASALRSKSGGVWCRGLCRDLPLSDVVKRVSAIRDNVVRLEIARNGPGKPVKPHIVPYAPATPGERATQQRSAAVGRVVSSRKRIQKSAAAAASTAARLQATREALAATRGALGKEGTEARGANAHKEAQRQPSAAIQPTSALA